MQLLGLLWIYIHLSYTTYYTALLFKTAGTIQLDVSVIQTQNACLLKQQVLFNLMHL